MYQRQATKSNSSHQAGARRDTRPVAPLISEHDRWTERERGIGNQAVSRLLQRRAAAGPPAAGASAEPPPAGADRILQRKCACGGGAAGPTGECEECSRKKNLGLQTKLRINEPGDVYEQEADRVAEQVLAKPAHPDVSSAPPRIQRYTGQGTGQMRTAPASVDHVLAGSGRPLDPSLRRDMEQRFDRDFSQVRVHTGAAAEQSAQDVSAHAYTVGHNIVFDAGRFAPATHEGRRLLAHELTHLVQQSGGNGIRVGQSGDKRNSLPIASAVFARTMDVGSVPALSARPLQRTGVPILQRALSTRCAPASQLLEPLMSAGFGILAEKFIEEDYCSKIGCTNGNDVYFDNSFAGPVDWTTSTLSRKTTPVCRCGRQSI